MRFRAECEISTLGSSSPMWSPRSVTPHNSIVNGMSELKASLLRQGDGAGRPHWGA
jgi:hypothetical protein